MKMCQADSGMSYRPNEARRWYWSVDEPGIVNGKDYGQQVINDVVYIFTFSSRRLTR